MSPGAEAVSLALISSVVMPLRFCSVDGVASFGANLRFIVVSNLVFATAALGVVVSLTPHSEDAARIVMLACWGVLLTVTARRAPLPRGTTRHRRARETVC